MLAELVVDAEDGGRQGQELRTHNQIPVGNLFVVSDDY